MNKYSFVIPAYNYLGLLKNTLSSLSFLMPDTGISYEVIVVDDGSDDHTGEYIRGLEVDYTIKYIYIERTAHSSRSKARNRGIEIAEGNIIVFIDADIIVRPDYLLELNKFFKISKDIAVLGMRKLINEPIDDNAVKQKLIFCDDYVKRLKTDNEFRYYIFEDISYNARAFSAPFLYSQTCNLAIPKKWVDKTHGFDEDFLKWGIEDIEYGYRLYCLGINFVIHPRNYVFHQFHGVKQENIIDNRYEEDIRYNTDVFVRKYPKFLGLDENKIHELFKSIGIHYKDIEGNCAKEEIVFNVNNHNDINNLKNAVYGNGMKGKTVRINDCLKDSDLYVWIQTEADPDSMIRYYPLT